MLGNKDPNDRSHLGVVVDREIKLKPSKKLQQYLKDDNDALGSRSNDVLTIKDIQGLYKRIYETKGDPGKRVYLHELLEGGEILLPQLVIPTRNPELEKRVQKLKHELAEKEYQRMVQNVTGGTRFHIEDSIGYQLKQMNKGLIGVFQFVVTVGAAFLFGLIGIEVLTGYQLELAVKLLLGIIFALIVGLAELYFLAVNLHISEQSSTPEPPSTGSNHASSLPGSSSSPLKKTGTHLKIE